MNPAVRKARRFSCALAVAGALQFGAAQALAAPDGAHEKERSCSHESCRRHCLSKGFSGAFCGPDGCYCYD